MKAGDAVKLTRLTEDSDWIEAATGYKDVRNGLTGVIVGQETEGHEAPMWEVELDRNGERLLFQSRELKLIPHSKRKEGL